MQQFFSDVPLAVGEAYHFTEAQAHHARDVVRLNHETVRLVYQGQAYFACAQKEKGTYTAVVTQKDDHFNELPDNIILAMALIRREKMELVLQKAAELGVKEIVPFVSERCVVKEDHKPGKLQRRQMIVTEAAAQCKRNLIPTVHETAALKQLAEIPADVRAAAYENARENGTYVSELPQGKRIMIAIGPEGGFAPSEADWFARNGFTAVSLGSRILRAETAAIYACSVLGEMMERNRK